MKLSEAKIAQAIDYISGLMTANEEEQFENQLEVDMHLQEAVIQATRLGLAIASSDQQESAPVANVVRIGASLERVSASRPEQTNSRSRNVVRRMAVATSLLACTLVLAVTSNTIPRQQGVDAAIIIDAWASSEPSDSEADFAASDDDSTDLDVPDWMLTAVSAVEPSEELPTAL